MSNPSIPFENPSLVSSPSLHILVDQLIDRLIPENQGQGTAIINDIREDFQTNKDPGLLAIVIGGLIYHCFLRSWKNYIKITARAAGNLTIVEVRNNIQKHRNYLPGRFCMASLLAERLGGSLRLSNNILDGTTIHFAFPNG